MDKQAYTDRMHTSMCSSLKAGMVGWLHWAGQAGQAVLRALKLSWLSFSSGAGRAKKGLAQIAAINKLY